MKTLHFIILIVAIFGVSFKAFARTYEERPIQREVLEEQQERRDQEIQKQRDNFESYIDPYSEQRSIRFIEDAFAGIEITVPDGIIFTGSGYSFAPFEQLKSSPFGIQYNVPNSAYTDVNIAKRFGAFYFLEEETEAEIQMGFFPTLYAIAYIEKNLATYFPREVRWDFEEKYTTSINDLDFEVYEYSFKNEKKVMLWNSKEKWLIYFSVDREQYDSDYTVVTSIIRSTDLLDSSDAFNSALKEKTEEHFERIAVESNRKKLKKFEDKPLSSSFADVLISNDFYTAIAWAQVHSIVGGYPDGTFKPNKAVSRVEFLKIAIGLLNDWDASIRSEIVLDFTDTDNSQWYAPYLFYAKSIGVVQGYEDGSFQPNRTVNFAEGLKMIYKILGIKLEETDGPWYAKYFKHAIDNNILKDSSVDPSSPMSRQDVVWIVWKLYIHISTENSQSELSEADNEQVLDENESKEVEVNEGAKTREDDAYIPVYVYSTIKKMYDTYSALAKHFRSEVLFYRVDQENVNPLLDKVEENNRELHDIFLDSLSRDLTHEENRRVYYINNENGQLIFDIEGLLLEAKKEKE